MYAGGRQRNIYAEGIWRNRTWRKWELENRGICRREVFEE
jgi:hypothetical protein